MYKLFLFLQQGYLMKFGYLPDMNLETANLQSDEQLQDALRTLQASYT